jgi:uncharacterized protein YndB with AHSA1/START domain
MILPAAARAALAAALVAALPCTAATSEVSPAGFVASFREDVDASPAEAWAAITQVSRWWDGDHTYSGNPANLSLDPAAGGCWCERWDGNSVEHMRVVQALRNKTLRLEGGLGPLQARAVNGVLTFGLAPNGAKTTLTVTYRVRGSPDAGLDKVAEAVDRVLGAQVGRLAALLRPSAQPQR